jgi:hypothetical protein
MAEAGAIVSTTLLEVLIFSGDKETREHDGRKHIGAADLLREMARRKAANPAWNDEARRHRTLRQELQERRSSVVGRGHTIRQQSEDAKGDYDLAGV